jgi:hypothetical protein
MANSYFGFSQLSASLQPVLVQNALHPEVLFPEHPQLLPLHEHSASFPLSH